MKQTIPHSHSDLLSASALAIYGATKHAGTINLAYNNAAAIEQTRLAAIAARVAYDAAMVDLRELRLEYNRTVVEARGFSMLTRDLLKPGLGRFYSAAWAGTGFVGSLEVSEKGWELALLAEGLKKYLEKNPTKEAPGSGVTAAKAEELRLRLENGRNEIQTMETNLRILGQNRRKCFLALRKRLTDLARELLQLIPKTDNRWLDYGLNIPGVPERPEAPVNVTVTEVAPNQMAVEWDKTPRAKYYRVGIKVVGVDQEARVIGTPVDPDFMIEEEFPAGAEVEVSICAVNDGGESRWSETIRLPDRNSQSSIADGQ